MRTLNRDIVAQYDISIKKYQYIRSSYYLDTNKGKLILRKMDVPKEQIVFDYEVDTHLSHNHFQNINPIYTTKKKVPYVLQGDQLYIMQKYIECGETDFRDLEDLRHTILVLADFHRIARNIISQVKDIDAIVIKNMYDYYLKRSIQNAKLRKNILEIKQKSMFEMMFLENCEVYTALEQMALEGINKELGEKLIVDAKQNYTVAHRDYTYHTVNKAYTGEYIMNNIDVCHYDIQMIDLAHILGRIMQKNEWDVELLHKLISAYDSQNILSQEEFKLLKAMMIYPEKYNSICSKYMGSKRRWNYSMFEQKWENMIVYRNRQLEAAKIIRTW